METFLFLKILFFLFYFSNIFVVGIHVLKYEVANFYNFTGKGQ